MSTANLTMQTELDLEDHIHAWTDQRGERHAALWIGNANSLRFDSAQDARAFAAKCIEAAEAIERLTEQAADAEPLASSP